MLESLARELSGPNWEGMSSAERDQARATVSRLLERLKQVSPEMAFAGTSVLKDHRLQWGTDEARAIAVFHAMLEV